MTLIIILSLVGIILILSEVFLPGGIIGGIGFVCIGTAIYFSYKAYDFPGLFISAAVLITTGILTWLAALKLLPRTPLGRDLFLTKTQKGYDTLNKDLSELIGKKGTTLSSLRPTGKVLVEDVKYDAVTDGDFIERGAQITVVGIRSNQLIVILAPKT